MPLTCTACRSATRATSAAYWLGYPEYLADGKATKTPRMLGFQAAGAAPIVLGQPVLQPVTVATAIRIGNPASWHLAEEARAESGGLIGAVTDEQILAAYRLLAQREGVFGEPASAAGVAGLLQASAAGQVAPGSIGRVHDHRARPEGPRYGGRRRAVADDGRHRCRAPRPVRSVCDDSA